MRSADCSLPPWCHPLLLWHLAVTQLHHTIHGFGPSTSNAKSHLCPFNFSLSSYACFLPSSGTVHSVAAPADGSKRGEFLLLANNQPVWGWHLLRTLLFAYQQAEEQVKWDWWHLYRCVYFHAVTNLLPLKPPFLWRDLSLSSPLSPSLSLFLSKLFFQGEKEKADRNRRQETTAWGPDTSAAAFQGKGLMPEMMDWLNLFIIRHADHMPESWEKPTLTWSSFHCRSLSLTVIMSCLLFIPWVSCTGPCCFKWFMSMESGGCECRQHSSAVIIKCCYLLYKMIRHQLLWLGCALHGFSQHFLPAELRWISLVPVIRFCVCVWCRRSVS